MVQTQRSSSKSGEPPSTRSGFDSPTGAALKVARFVGLIGCLGGFAALAALTWLGPQPLEPAQWHMMISAIRSIFYPCAFGGIIVLIVVGGVIWWRRRRLLNPQPWFRLMMALILVAVPALHLWARSSMLKMDAAVEQGDLAIAASMWNQLRWAFLIALAVFLVIAAIGIIKPGKTFAPMRRNALADRRE